MLSFSHLSTPHDDLHPKPQRILLGHLAAFGDCLCATVVARQIKHDFPGCHLTWAVAAPYRQVIEDNPYVDVIWEIPVSARDAVSSGWKPFVRAARERHRNGEFDSMFFTQVPPGNYRNFDGTVRASILRGYPRPITVPLTPVLRLRTEEIERVRTFAEQHGLTHGRPAILFECAALSGQTFVTPDFALQTARQVSERVEDCRCVLSSSTPVSTQDSRIIDGSVLRFRENAELTKYVSLFVGCYSGITWLSTSDWARRLPSIQLLRKATSVFASPCHDAAYFGLPSDHLIEMTDCTPGHAASCIEAALTSPFVEVRRRFHEVIPVDHTFYFNTFILSLLKNGHPLMAAGSIRTVVARYGWASLVNTFRKTFESL